MPSLPNISLEVGEQERNIDQVTQPLDCSGEGATKPIPRLETEHKPGLARLTTPRQSADQGDGGWDRKVGQARPVSRDRDGQGGLACHVRG